jgi:hypothetical protein
MLLSATALAAGWTSAAMGQTTIYNVNTTVGTGQVYDLNLNGDGTTNYAIRFDGKSSTDTSTWNDTTKPFVSVRTQDTTDASQTTFVLGVVDPNQAGAGGLPLTGAGATIGPGYLTPVNVGYLYQDYGGNTVGGWSSTSISDGYVGLELVSDNGAVTNYGWLELEYDYNGGLDSNIIILRTAYNATFGKSLVTPPLSVPPPPPPTPILANGGFEHGQTNWSSVLRTGGSATFTTVLTNVHSGSQTLLVTVNNPGTASNSVQLVSAPFTASSSDTYVLRFWASSPVLLANLGVNFIGATPVYPQIPFELSTNPVATSTDGNYQEYLYAFNASGTVSVAFNFQTAGQYWLDDVEVLDVTNNNGFDVPMTYLWQWGQMKFSQTNSLKIGWGGGDNDKSALLPDGSVAWIFNDSYASTLNSFYSNIRGNSSLPRNCVVHQIGTNLVCMNNGNNTLFVPANPADIYWIGGAKAEGNKLLVLLNEINNSALTNVAMAVATLSLPNLTLIGITTLTSPSTDNFGDFVAGDDGYYYIYNGPKVARAPVGSIAVDSAWTYWNGSTWVADHTQNVAITNFNVWSIARLGTSNYVSVFFPYLDFVNINAQFAPTPMGPWTAPVVVAHATPQWGEIMYAPNICAGTGSNGVYSIGYSDNGSPENWFSKTYSDKSWYNPHFVTADLLKLSPYTPSNDVAAATVSVPVPVPSYNVYGGTSLTLICSNYTGTPPYNFRWQFSVDGTSFVDIGGSTTNALTLPAVNTNNSGYYRLQLTAGGQTVASAALQVVVNPLPMINAQQMGNNLILSWPLGTLLQATNLTGPWVTNSAVSPYTNPVVALQMFYKLRSQ